ncbi:MAG: hypothetical protein M1814_000675 [Vezdaea aestivalis]|nr:MAG: hypothetical protein M1814_000675 [Vezdaea aestivalis]
MSSPLQFNRPGTSNPIFPSRAHDRQQRSTGIPRQISQSPTNGRTERGNDARRSRGLGLAQAFAATATSDDGDQGLVLLTGSGELSPEKKALRSYTKPPYSSRSRVPRANDNDTSSPLGISHHHRLGTATGLKDAYRKVERADQQREQRWNTSTYLSGARNRISRDFSDPDLLRERLHSRMDPTARSGSPASFTRTRKSTPSPDPDHDSEPVEVGIPKVDFSVNSGSGSDLSGFSGLQSETDPFLQRMLEQHEKDQQRVKGALSDKKGVFTQSGQKRDSDSPTEKRSSVPAPVGAKRDWRRNFERRGGDENGSIASDGSDSPSQIPVQIQAPRGWASKSRGRTNYLRKIEVESSRPQSSTTEAQHAATHEVDWVSAAAEVPVPSIENIPLEPPTARSPIELQPQDSNDTHDKILAWEAEEFTAPVQVSTSPPMKPKRDPLLELAREKEFESLRKSAVATNIIGEITQRTSKDSLKSQYDEEALSNSPDRPTLKKSRSGSLRETLSRKQGSDAARALAAAIENEAEELPEVLPKQDRRRSIPIKDDVEEPPKPADRISTLASGRPEVSRVDSRELLRQLARATSTSPPPTATENPSGPPESKPLPEARSRKLREAPQTPLQAAAASSNAPPGTSLTNKKTPHVMGGWIDTPLPAPRSNPIPKNDLSSIAPVSNPAHGKRSMFTTVRHFLLRTKPNRPASSTVNPPQSSNLTPFVSDDPEPPLDDATLDSLFPLLLADDHSLTSASDRLIFDAANAHLNQPHVASSAAQTRSVEASNAAALSLALRNVQRSIHSSRRGIEGLQRAVEASSTEPSTSSSIPTEGWADWPIRPLRPFVQREGRPTLLGWVVLCYLAWYFIESMACMHACHEMYMPGSSNSDSEAPLWGWATLYLLEKALPWVFGPVGWAARAMAKRWDLLVDWGLDILDLDSEVLDWEWRRSTGDRRLFELWYLGERKRRRGEVFRRLYP